MLLKASTVLLLEVLLSESRLSEESSHRAVFEACAVGFRLLKKTTLAR